MWIYKLFKWSRHSPWWIYIWFKWSRNSQFSKPSEGSYRLRGSFENCELTDDSSDPDIHNVHTLVKVRIGFAEVLKMVKLHMIKVLQKFNILKNEWRFDNCAFTCDSRYPEIRHFQKRVKVRIGVAEVLKMVTLHMIQVIQTFTIFKNEWRFV